MAIAKFKIRLTIIFALVSFASFSQRPNILFCIADDASYEHFGANGSKWVKTPEFDRVAKEGLLFTNAYTPNAKCAPSRASVLMGRNSWQLEELGNHLAYWPARYLTAWERLAANGYKAGFTGKGWAPGVAMTVNGKPHLLTGTGYHAKKLIAPTSGISTTDYAANFEDFLNDRKNNEPFIFWFGSHEPHREFEYGSGLKSGKQTRSIPSVFKYWPDTDSVRNDLLDYAVEVEYFDQTVGRMIGLLEKKRLLNNTIIVITSDNGMAFPRVKGQQYEQSNHMPLAIMWKDGINKPGRIIKDYVSFIDFAPTFFEVSATTSPTDKYNKPQGQSLLNLLKTEKQGWVETKRDRVLLGQERHDVGRPNEVGYPIRSIIKGGYMYIHNFEPGRWPQGNPETGYLNTDGGPVKSVILNQNRKSPTLTYYWKMNFGKRPQEELYHLATDYLCLNNLAANKKYQQIKTSLKTELFTALKAQGDPRMFGKGYVFDIYPPTEGLNFYNLFLNGEAPPTKWVNKEDYETDPKVLRLNDDE